MSRVDDVWALMRQGEYYSVRDLANLSDQSRSTVMDIIKFFSKYGFVEQIGASELFTKKSTVNVSPMQSIYLLSCIANT
jgi:DNA-binding MarR family transcriptional regulator